MGQIYGLIDPTTKMLRYVGQTKGSAVRRFQHHLSTARRRTNKSHVYNWINSLLTEGIRPDLLILEEDCTELDYFEVFYIEYFKSIGCNLTNLSKGGNTRGGFKHTEEHKQHLKELFKGRKPWNTGLKLSEEQKINHFTPVNFINLSRESLIKRAKAQSKTKALKSKVSNTTILFIRENYPRLNQIQLSKLLNLRQDYISDVINLKIRKDV